MILIEIYFSVSSFWSYFVSARKLHSYTRYALIHFKFLSDSSHTITQIDSAEMCSLSLCKNEWKTEKIHRKNMLLANNRFQSPNVHNIRYFLTKYLKFICVYPKSFDWKSRLNVDLQAFRCLLAEVRALVHKKRKISLTFVALTFHIIHDKNSLSIRVFGFLSFSLCDSQFSTYALSLVYCLHTSHIYPY